MVDASRARLFTYERSSEAEGLSEHLVEQRDLVNPARRLRAGELFSESRPGSSRTGGLQYTLDDHREAHIDALDAEFARLIISEVLTLLRTTKAQRLIVCASPRMLGDLRDAGHELTRSSIVTDEIPRDLCKLTAPQLRDQLASYGVLPPKPARPTQPQH
ncbi:MAG TPA: host attachment protein [Kofleriaceae bacterium]